MGERSGTTRKALVIGVCVLSLAAALGLAWWQWQRFESASGTFQNLGYVLQWPLFGLAPAYMVWRFRALRARETAAPEPPEPSRPPVPTRAGGGDEPDDELAAYNRYLAALNEQENR